MSRTIVNPPTLHDPSGYGYSHAVSVPAGELVFIGGQYASDASGGVTSPDFRAQVEQSLRNLGVALAAVGLGFEHVVKVGLYVANHDAAKLGVVVELLRRTWGDGLPAATLTGVAALALPEMQFEIDAIAVRS